jgi:hypothetical protein
LLSKGSFPLIIGTLARDRGGCSRRGAARALGRAGGAAADCPGPVPGCGPWWPPADAAGRRRCCGGGPAPTSHVPGGRGRAAASASATRPRDHPAGQHAAGGRTRAGRRAGRPDADSRHGRALPQPARPRGSVPTRPGGRWQPGRATGLGRPGLITCSAVDKKPKKPARRSPGCRLEDRLPDTPEHRLTGRAACGTLSHTTSPLDSPVAGG